MCLASCPTKLLEGQSPWAVTVSDANNNVISIIGEVPSPVQCVDRTTAECLYQAQLERSTMSDAADKFLTKLRATTLDGASSNEKAEREGGKLSRPSRVCSCYQSLHMTLIQMSSDMNALNANLILQASLGRYLATSN